MLDTKQQIWFGAKNHDTILCMLLTPRWAFANAKYIYIMPRMRSSTQTPHDLLSNKCVGEEMVRPMLLFRKMLGKYFWSVSDLVSVGFEPTSFLTDATEHFWRAFVVLFLNNQIQWSPVKCHKVKSVPLAAILFSTLKGVKVSPRFQAILQNICMCSQDFRSLDWACYHDNFCHTRFYLTIMKMILNMIRWCQLNMQVSQTYANDLSTPHSSLNFKIWIEKDDCEQFIYKLFFSPLREWLIWSTRVTMYDKWQALKYWSTDQGDAQVNIYTNKLCSHPKAVLYIGWTMTSQDLRIMLQHIKIEWYMTQNNC